MYVASSTMQPSSSLSPCIEPMLKFPDIPLELILKILSFAAYSSQQSALFISLVATCTRSVAVPALYQIVSIKRDDAHQRFMRTLAEQGLTGKRGVQGSVGLKVTGLLNPYASKEELLRCITSCPNIEDLAIRNSQLFHLTTLLRDTTIAQEDESQTNFAANVKKLTIIDSDRSLAWTMGTHSESPRLLQVLSNITHLVFINSWGPNMHLPLRSFPNLTHIAAPLNGVLPSIANRQETMQILDRAKTILLDAGKHLKILILHVSAERLARKQEDLYELPSIRGLVLDANRGDERIHILPMNRYDTFVFQNWEKEARGEGSIWDDAADLLRKTRKIRGSARLGRRLSLG